MFNSENLKFANKRILPIISITVIITFAIYFVFPSFSLTFGVFTLVSCSLTMTSFILNYQARRWTLSVVKQYGVEKEENPVMRKMLTSGNSKQYWITWLSFFLLIFFLCIFPFIIGANDKIYLILLLAPLCLFANYI